MRIEHLALWTDDIARCVDFYVRYFGAHAGAAYENPKKGFSSRFLEFDDGARIEVMHTEAFAPLAIEAGAQRMGLTHFAVSVGSEAQVDALTTRLRDDGYSVLDRPRHTGDGYYESVVLDPDGNRLEITV